MCLKRPYLAYIIDSLTSTSGYIPIRVKKQDFTVTSASWQNEKTSWSVPLKLQVGQLQFNKASPVQHTNMSEIHTLRYLKVGIWEQAGKEGWREGSAERLELWTQSSRCLQ